MKNKIFYLIVVLFTLVLCLVFDVDGLRFLLTFEIILIPVMLVLAFYLSRKCVAAVAVPYYHTHKDNEFKVVVSLKNNSILPISSLKVRLRCVSGFDGREWTMSDEAMLDSRGEAVLEFYLKSSYCGKYMFNAHSVRVYDYLRLFGIKIKNSGLGDAVMVLPRFRQIFIGGNAVTKNKHEWEQYSHTSSGEDTSEVFDLHQYRPGDTLQKVHWKLTAKTDEVMVKEYSMPVKSIVLLFADLFCEDIKGISREKQDCFLEVLAALSWSMTKQNLPHVVIWHSVEKNGLVTVVVESEGDVYEMVESICEDSLYDEYLDIRALYSAKYEKILIENSLLINMDVGVYRDDICLKKFETDDLEKELLEWKLEI